MKRFYRVCKPESSQGLWYDPEGKFTGDIVSKYDFCKASKLPMDYDKSLVGYLSATPTLMSLFVWFTEEEILELQKYGYFIYVYEAEDWWFYERYKHFVINQKTSKIIKRIEL